MVVIDSRLDTAIRRAIERRRLIQFVYKTKQRIVEPHDYGIKDGVAKLFTFQVGGQSSEKLPNWRWVDVGGISDLQILEKAFPGGRGSTSRKHHKWDQIFARVKPPEDTTTVASVPSATPTVLM